MRAHIILWPDVGDAFGSTVVYSFYSMMGGAPCIVG
jgi:hypothetical protein